MSDTVVPTWACLELLGHRVLYGRLSEVTMAGAGFLRIDVPAPTPGEPMSVAATQFYSPSSVYAITPMSEADVRECVRRHYRPATVPMLPAPLGRDHDVDEYGNRYDGDPEDDDYGPHDDAPREGD